MAVDPSEDRAPSGTQTTAQTGERAVTVDLSGPPSVVETITAGSGFRPPHSLGRHRAGHRGAWAAYRAGEFF